jgi:hypothetical protein
MSEQEEKHEIKTGVHMISIWKGVMGNHIYYLTSINSESPTM